MESNTAFLNLNVILNAPASGTCKADKPDYLVAGWKSNYLHRKASWKGRIWQFIRWATQTYNSSLRRALVKTKAVAKSSLRNSNNTLQEIGSEGSLGNFWKKRDVKDARFAIDSVAKLRDALGKVDEKGMARLLIALTWAGNKCNKLPESLSSFASEKTDAAIKVADYKTDRAEFFAKRWKRMCNQYSIGLFYRELISEYPVTDEELKNRRDKIQKTPLTGTYGKKIDCPEALIYAPVIALSRDLAKNKKLAIDELEYFIGDLTKETSTKETRHNGALIVSLVKYFRNPKTAIMPKMPSVVQKSMQDKHWVDKCSVTRNSYGPLSCERGQHTEYHKIPRYGDYPATVLNLYPGYHLDFPHPLEAVHYDYIPYTVHTHHKQYGDFIKDRDGKEHIGSHQEVVRIG